MKIRVALLYYLVFLLIWCSLFMFSVMHGLHYFYLPFFSYFAFGIFLGKKVHNELVEYHPVHATIDNIAGDKIRMIIFWILKYPFLFFSLAIAKYF